MIAEDGVTANAEDGKPDVVVNSAETDVAKPIHAVSEFVARLQILDTIDNVNNMICVEKFSDFAQLGRFTLRTEGKTVAVGMVTDLPTASE
ncbi:UNVERIFIED_CONTAM: hypothetical protein Sradi_1687700 [Sesamum radiatum]|uniref:GTP-eEF1A C-terminal domain-containing protein n=1 Tax=Sesamum radiatum TaxID=300843 RepID=A0AAW2UD64_SESRA